MPKQQLKLFMEQNPRLREDWDEQYGDRMQKLVFIGQNLDKKALAAELDKCLEV
jgi:G3E family GTPase